ncbi:MAG: hypothetical protein WC089_03570 [Candidatus Paceibacterota bacterium]
MKTKNTVTYILIILILMIITSCGPSAEERAAREKPISEKIKSEGMVNGVVYVELINGDSIDCSNTSVTEIYALRITLTLTKFKKEHPKMRVISSDVQYFSEGNGKTYPVGIQIIFEPKEIPRVEKRPEWMDNLVEGTISIPKGGTLCGTLGMTEKEALDFARANDIKYWYEGKILKVDIQPEDWINFKTKVVKEWKKVKPFYHNRGHS